MMMMMMMMDFFFTDFYVKTCEEDHTADTCEPCPRGFFMLQSTDSHFPFPCEKISCPPGKF